MTRGWSQFARWSSANSCGLLVTRYLKAHTMRDCHTQGSGILSNLVLMAFSLTWGRGWEGPGIGWLRVFINIHENNNAWIPVVNSAFCFVDIIFLELNILGRVRVWISTWDSPLWLTRAANSVIYWCLWSNQLTFAKFSLRASFAVMHSRADASFVFSVELEKLAVTKILPGVY